MFNDDLSKQICKIFGPIIVFLGFPLLSYICYKVVLKDLNSGVQVSNKTISEMIIVCIIVFGLFTTYKGYEDKFRK